MVHVRLQSLISSIVHPKSFFVAHRNERTMYRVSAIETATDLHDTHQSAISRVSSIIINGTVTAQ